MENSMRPGLNENHNVLGPISTPSLTRFRAELWTGRQKRTVTSLIDLPRGTCTVQYVASRNVFAAIWSAVYLVSWCVV